MRPSAQTPQEDVSRLAATAQTEAFEQTADESPLPSASVAHESEVSIPALSPWLASRAPRKDATPATLESSKVHRPWEASRLPATLANPVGQPVAGAIQGSSEPARTSAVPIPYRPVDSNPAIAPKPMQNLQEVMNNEKGTSLSDVALKLGDLPFRLVGGIAAGGNPVVQYEYQRAPFTPLNWIFKYDAAPTAEQALKWTDAQISLNDALEAGLVAKNTRSLKPNEPVTIKLRRRKGEGSPGLAFVFEPGQKDPSKPSDRYQLEFPMSSDIESRQTWVPALGYKNRNSHGINFVRFDAVDQKNYIVYDAKWNTTTLPKQKNDIERQMRALIQNPSWSLIVEVPNAAVEAKAMATYNAVIRALSEPGHPRVEIRVVPPGTRDSSHYDFIPMESAPPPPIRKISPPRPGTPVMREGP